MAWLTTLDSAKRIIREQRFEPIKSVTASGTMTDPGGIHYLTTTIGMKRFTTYEYTGIAASSAQSLVASLETQASTIECYFQYGEAGGGSIIWRVRVDEYD
jgi:hypothetical protein